MSFLSPHRKLHARLTTPRVLAMLFAAATSAHLAAAATWTVAPSGGDFTSLATAIANASVVNGDTINVAAGTYAHPNTTLTVNKQLTIVGAGMGSTIITHTNALATDTTTVSITAANVTLKNLTISFGNGEGANIYRGVGSTTAAANTTYENVEFDANYARRFIFVNNNSKDTTIKNCVFTGEMNREGIDINNNTVASPGTLLIEGCTFKERHFQQGSIFFDGANGQNVIIRRNFFISRVGVYSASNTMPDANYGFQSDGTLLYNIYIGTLTNGRTVLIDNNTFVFQDGSTLNRSNAVPQMRAIDMVTTANHGATGAPVTISDNIFTGYIADETAQITAQGPAYQFQSSSGIFGGALELDGSYGFGEFLATTAFNIGAKGTLSAWVKLDDIAKRNQILEGPGNDTGLEFQFRNNTSGQFFIRPYGGSEYTIQSGSAGTTNWVLIQYTWDQSIATARIYSGNQSTSVAESAYLAANDQNVSGWTAPVDTTTGTITVGSDPGDSTRRFNGLMDDLIVFNDVLTPAELETLRTSGGAAFSADSRRVGHWKFDETSGNTAASEVNSLTIDLKDARTGNINSLVISSNTGASAPTVTNNLFFNNETTFLSGPTDVASVLGDPLFTGTGATPAQVYKPLAASPAIGAASDGGAIGAVAVTRPTLAANTALTVVSGGTGIVSTARLNATDPEQTPAQLTYTVTSAPTLGTLSLTTFTQADINNNLVTYTNTSAGSTDSFGFSVTDGDTIPVTGTFNINIVADVDTDLDGLPDALETTLGTNPALKDTDGDGIEDGVERAIGYDPLVAAALPDRTDTDRDLLPDNWETANGFNAANADQDGDGFRDGYELAAGGTTSLAGVPTFGDVNATSLTDNNDASVIFNYYLGNIGAPVKIARGDIDRDGNIDYVDAVILFNWSLVPKRVSIIPYR